MCSNHADNTPSQPQHPPQKRGAVVRCPYRSRFTISSCFTLRQILSISPRRIVG
jgi:hypothetical protein